MRPNSKNSYISGLVFIILFTTIIYFVFFFTKGMFGENIPNLDGPYEVIRVVDGDTIVVEIQGKERNIRLIGVDSPESVADESYKQNTEEGIKASKYTQDILEDQRVYLEYDKDQYDTYGRKLCYVYLASDKTLFNELIVKEGYARVMTVEPNHMHESRFVAAEEKARKEGKGFWGTGFFK
jgi:micrococcal nuclease